MRKGWKFVGILFVVVLFLGVVFLGVGFLTGGDAERIFQVADASLSITDSFNNYQNSKLFGYHQASYLLTVWQYYLFSTISPLFL